MLHFIYCTSTNIWVFLLPEINCERKIKRITFQTLPYDKFIAVWMLLLDELMYTVIFSAMVLMTYSSSASSLSGRVMRKPRRYTTLIFALCGGNFVHHHFIKRLNYQFMNIDLFRG